MRAAGVHLSCLLSLLIASSASSATINRVLHGVVSVSFVTGILGR